MKFGMQRFFLDDKPFLYAESRWFSRNELFQLATRKVASGYIKHRAIIQSSSDSVIDFFCEFIGCIISGATFMPVTNKAGLRVSECINTLDKDAYLALFELNSIRPVIVLSSGGTVSGGKAILLSEEGLFRQAISFAKLSCSDTNSFYCSVSPKDYMAGIFNNFLVPLVSGGRVAWVNLASPSANDLMVFERFGGQFNRVVATPFLLERLLRIDVLSGDHVECMSTGARGTNRLVDLIANRKWSLSQAFGVTELGGSFSYESCVERGKWDDQGTLIPEMKCRNIKDTSRLEFKNPLGALSVIDINGAIQNVKESWFQSGDLGTTERNRLSVVGRESEIVDRQGYLVALFYIEETAKEISGVLDAVCYLNNETPPGRLKLYLVACSKAHQSKQFIVRVFRALSEILDPWEMPDEIKLVERLPRTQAGKLLRGQLETIPEITYA